MPDYRLYLLNSTTDAIEDVEVFHASDDVEAVHRNEHRKRGQPTELWRGEQKIRYFPSTVELGAHH